MNAGVLEIEPLEDWIDNQDVMQLLHISQRTLQTLRSNGTLPFRASATRFTIAVPTFSRCFRSIT